MNTFKHILSRYTAFLWAILQPLGAWGVFAVAATEISISHFLLAIFLGRMVRFLVLGILVLQFGPGVVHTLRIFFSHHFHWILIAAVVALGIWLVTKRLAKRAAAQLTEP